MDFGVEPPEPYKVGLPETHQPQAYFKFKEKWHCSETCRSIPRRGNRIVWDWIPRNAIDEDELRRLQCNLCCVSINVGQEKIRRAKEAKILSIQRESDAERELRYAQIREQIFDPEMFYERGVFGLGTDILPHFTSSGFKTALGWAMACYMIADIRLREIPDSLHAYCLRLVRVDPKTFHQLLSKHGVDDDQAADEGGMSEASKVRVGIMRVADKMDKRSEEDRVELDTHHHEE